MLRGVNGAGDIMGRLYRIGQAAARADITIHQARCYVAAGLVASCATTEGGYHLFNETCIARLRLIGAATRAGLRLEEMRGFYQALDAQDTEKVDTTRDLLEARLSERRTALRRVRKLLSDACHIAAELNQGSAGSSRTLSASTKSVGFERTVEYGTLQCV